MADRKKQDSRVKVCGIVCGVGIAMVACGAGMFHNIFKANSIRFIKYHSYEEILFNNLDVDGDGWLSPNEFAVIAHKITPVQRERRDIPERNVTLRTFFDPLVLSSLRSYTDADFSSKIKESLWQGLVQWQTAAQTELNVTNMKLSYFLPPLHALDVGIPWPLFLTNEAGVDGCLRYDPPASSGIQSVIEHILKAFHPRPFLEMRFGPTGGHAVLKARSHDYFEVAFRIHAEFQLNPRPTLPFWFTPAQFAGNIVFSHNGAQVNHFRLYVPTKHQLNVDIEMMTDITNDQDLTVEIGFLPRMEIVTVESAKWNPTDNGPLDTQHRGDIKWDEHITMEEAESILEKSFFPFKQIEYLPYVEAFEKAAVESKLVHSIVLWGALGDQSC